VAIEGATLEEATRDFREHLNSLLARTVTQARLVALAHRSRSRAPLFVALSFRQGGEAIEAPLRTRYGPMHLYLGQRCESVKHGRRHRLVTAAYRYTLRAEGTPEPLLRWEYERHWPDSDARWCRHHLQGDVSLPLGGRNVSLSALHTPTGYVTVEEVLRFCIVDLGVEPLAADWHDQLKASYARFKGDFVS